MSWTGSQRVAVAGISILAAFAVYGVVSSFHGRRGDTAINSVERAAELARAGKREQVITFSTGMTPVGETKTTDASLYVIGVGQYTLGEPEQIEVSRYSPQGSYRGFNGGLLDGRYRDDFVSNKSLIGPFNNLLIFDKRMGSTEKVFNTRISISQVTIADLTNPPVLAIFAASADSNRDGLVDDDDLQDLYIYATADHILHKVAALDASPESVIDIPGVNYLVIQAAADKNRDGKITSRTDGDVEIEPRFLYRVDLHTFEAVPLLPAELVKTLQKTIDGTTAPRIAK